MTKILGQAKASAYQMSKYLLSKNPNPKFSRNISAIKFCQIFLDECAKENVRGDVAFAQACKETGNFAYGGDVAYTQNNFAGIGATGNKNPGNTFETIEIGVLAQAQHLKSYACKDELNEPNVDPRRTKWFMDTKGGSSPDVETLGGSWAVPGYNTVKYKSLAEANTAKDSYGYQIITILNNILAIDDKQEDKPMGYKIAIDAGHGSNTAGKRSPDGYREHWINVKCANFFDIAMKRCCIETLKVAWDDTISTDDEDVALTTRQAQIKAAKCDVSVSWHANAYGNGGFNSANGLETLIHNNASKVGDSKALADKVHSYLIQGTKQTNRGVKGQALSMCNCPAMGVKAAILIEIGFMTNEKEIALMKTDAFCLECAEEAAKGVCDYLGVKYVAPNESSSTAGNMPNKQGWIKENGKWKFYLTPNHYIKNDWYKYEDKWYFFGADGNMVESAWVNWKNVDYYMLASGEMAVDSFVLSQDKNTLYYVNADGEWESSKDLINTPSDRIVFTSK